MFSDLKCFETSRGRSHFNPGPGLWRTSVVFVKYLMLLHGSLGLMVHSAKYKQSISEKGYGN